MRNIVQNKGCQTRKVNKHVLERSISARLTITHKDVLAVSILAQRQQRLRQHFSHSTKKASVDEWVGAVKGGRMTSALRHLNPRRGAGPWVMSCDNERFLTAADSVKAYAAKKIELWQILPRSLALNPIEKFWGWLRRELRRRVFKDLQERRAVLSKTAFRARVRAILQTRKIQRAAARFASGLLSVCRKVKAKRGAASRG